VISVEVSTEIKSLARSEHYKISKAERYHRQRIMETKSGLRTADYVKEADYGVLLILNIYLSI